MDQRERFNDLEEMLRAAVEGELAGIVWTSLVGVVQQYDPITNRCTVQPLTKIRRRHQDGTITFDAMTQLVDVPVLFPGAGNFLLTFPLQAGDEVVVMFSARDTHAWWQQGSAAGPVVPSRVRMFSLSDGFALPRVWSQPIVPANISPNSVQLRTLDGTTLIELAPGGVVNIKAPGGVNLTGALVATGELTAKNVHTVSAHVHGGVTAGGANTGLPTG